MRVIISVSSAVGCVGVTSFKEEGSVGDAFNKSLDLVSRGEWLDRPAIEGDVLSFTTSDHGNDYFELVNGNWSPLTK